MLKPRHVLFTLSTAALLLICSAAHAQNNPLIEEGIKQYNDLEYENSINTLSAALIRPGNSKEQKIEIYQYLGLNYLILGREEEAEGAFRSLLAIDETWSFDPVSTPPKFLEFFEQVKEKWIAEGKPGVETLPVVEKPVVIFHKVPDKGKKGDEVDLKIELENPKKTPVTVVIYYKPTESKKYKDMQASLKGYSDDGNKMYYMATIPAEAVVDPSVDYFIQVEDASGNVINIKGDENAPLRIPVPGEGKKKRALIWGLVGGLGGAVVLGLVIGLPVALLMSKNGGGNGTPEPAQVTVVICEEGTPGCI